jgi:hypothetical protein
MDPKRFHPVLRLQKYTEKIKSLLEGQNSMGRWPDPGVGPADFFCQNVRKKNLHRIFALPKN